MPNPTPSIDELARQCSESACQLFEGMAADLDRRMGAALGLTSAQVFPESRPHNKSRVKTGWDRAISDAKKGIKRLELAIDTFTERRDAGEPWPGDAAGTKTR